MCHGKLGWSGTLQLELRLSSKFVHDTLPSSEACIVLLQLGDTLLHILHLLLGLKLLVFQALSVPAMPRRSLK